MEFHVSFMIECYPVVLKVYYLSLYLFCSYLRVRVFPKSVFLKLKCVPIICLLLLTVVGVTSFWPEPTTWTDLLSPDFWLGHPQVFLTIGAKISLYLNDKSSLSDALIHSKQKQVFIELWFEQKGKMCCYCGFWIRLLLNQASFWHKLKIAN